MKAKAPSIIALLLALAAFGCATAAKHPYSDRTQLKQAFTQSVEECYAGRTDGTLSMPYDRGSMIRIVYGYKEPHEVSEKGQSARKAYSEWVDLRVRNSTWEIVVHQPVSGSDPILREQGEAIAKRMLTKLGSGSTMGGNSK